MTHTPPTPGAPQALRPRPHGRAGARRRRGLVAALISVTALTAGCSTPETDMAGTGVSTRPAPAGSSLPPGAGAPEVVTSGLAAPWSLVFLSDGTPLVSERDSHRILELDASGAAREVGVVDGVTGSGEGGLLGLAVGEDDGLYAYSTGDSGNRIQRFELGGEPGDLSLGEPETLLDGIPSASYHDGGRLAFGPDGMLYATTGDAGVRGAAQDPDNLAGKILRMTPDGAVPDDNPFPGSLVLSLGHRNPQGLAWAADGTLFATEFGQDTWDELNIIEAGGNYGWPEVEGVGGGGEFVDPERQWAPEDASPSGMAVVGDTVYLANLRGQVLRTVGTADPSTSTDLYSGGFGRLRDAAAAPDGSLWIVTGNTDGRGDPGEDDDRIVRIPLPTDG